MRGTSMALLMHDPRCVRGLERTPDGERGEGRPARAGSGARPDGRSRAARRGPGRRGSEPGAHGSVEGDRNRPRDLQGEVRNDEGQLRDRGDEELGAARRRPLLQPRQDRLLRRRRVLPRDQRLHGPVRDPRRAGGERCVARREDPGRSGHADEHARHGHVRDVRPEHAHDAGVRELPRQQAARRPGLQPVRQGRGGHGRRGLAPRRLRRGRAARQGARARARCRRPAIRT